MRLARLDTPEGHRLALATDAGWRELDVEHADLPRLLVERDGAVPVPSPGSSVLGDPSFAAPLRPGKIVAIGLNYLDHIRESGVAPPERPLVFAKFPSSVIGPEQPILLNPSVAERVDWEGELAVVIGKRITKASRQHALDGVFGYTIANDVSARDVQFADGQWIRGKNLDTFCPLGPVIVGADVLGDPYALNIRTTVNGETVQNASIGEMLFKIDELISFCSHSFTLEPGDVLLTGTPWGCGEFMEPRRSLRDGDVVEVEIDGIGVLRNPVSDPTS